MPESVFSQIWDFEGDTLDRLNRVYKVFSVSKFALLRRAYDMQKISFAEYKDIQSVLVSQLVPKGKGGGNANINLLARNGWDFTNAVLSELMEGNVSYPEAKGLLNVASHTRLDTLYDQLREGVYDISPRQ